MSSKTGASQLFGVAAPRTRYRVRYRPVGEYKARWKGKHYFYGAMARVRQRVAELEMKAMFEIKIERVPANKVPR